MMPKRDSNFIWLNHQVPAINITDAPVEEANNYAEMRLRNQTSKTLLSKRPFPRLPKSCSKLKKK